jgi:signal transduction histidine kinase
VLRVEQADDALRFSVSDTGPGIPPDKLEEIFDRYLQVRPDDRRGVGLGLYISRCIVLGHGGRIWADSRPGEGSTFFFTLPAHRADDSAGARPSAHEAPQEPTTI